MTDPTVGTAPDLIDRLIADWAREAPHLDTEAMGVVGRILWLGRLLEARMVDVLAPFDLHYTDLDLLATLRRSGEPFELTPTELRSAVLISSGAMSAALDRLERKGLISRGRAQEDGRIRTARLTPAGQALVEKAIAERFRDAASCIQALDDAQMTELAVGLKVLGQHLQTATAGPTQ